MPRVPKGRLLDFGTELLRRKGVAVEAAAYLAESAVATEACGIHTHGVVLFAHWDQHVGARIDPAASPEVVKEAPGSALLEGHSGFGQLALKLAREIAVEKAKACGVAMVAARNMSWLGALGPQVLPLGEVGFFAQLWAQASACKDCAPWGGIDPRFSTDPVALTFPTGSLPMVSDFSSAAISMCKTEALIRKGELVPENLYMDKDGKPSRDPRVVHDGGTLFFTGGEHYGYRGYALALWAEATAALAGGSANNPELPYRQSFALTVIDPAAFAGPDYYYREMARFLAHLRSSRLRPGFTAIRLPGERAQQAARDAEARGVLVEQRLLGLLDEVARRNGLDALR